MVERIRIEDLLMHQISGRKCKFPNSHYKCNPISNFWCKLLPWCKINHSHFFFRGITYLVEVVPPPIGSLHVGDCDDWLNIWGRLCSVAMLEPANTICIASDVNEKLFMAACSPAKITKKKRFNCHNQHHWGKWDIEFDRNGADNKLFSFEASNGKAPWGMFAVIFNL